MVRTPLPPSHDPGFNLTAHVLAAGRARPEHTALEIVTPKKSWKWSYAQLAASVQGVATGLRERLEPGQTVLLRLNNGPEFPIAFLGAIAAGVVPVPSSTQLTRREISKIADEVSAGLVLASSGAPLPDHPAPVIPEAELRSWQDLPPLEPVLGDPDRPAYIIYTSGTSGQPRAVIHAHRVILARQMMWDGWEGLRPEDRLMHAGAFNWTYTLGTGLLDPWSRGATALIPGRGVASATLPALIARHDASIFAAAPGIYRQLLRAPMPAMPKLRHGLSAGEKLSDELRRRWRAQTGTDLHEAYGMSECSTFISGSPARPAPPGSLGFAQQGRRISLRARGIEVAKGEIGTIAIHGSDPGVMLGYLGQPQETAARFDGDWFLTGDLARQDAEGAYHYQGRDDDMINAGGLRVSPIEIETALSAHPALHDVAAVELTVKADTTVIGAFYTLRDGCADPGAEAIGAFLEPHLAAYKRPRVLEQVAQLPRSANHKLNRRALRAAWEATHGHA